MSDSNPEHHLLAERLLPEEIADFSKSVASWAAKELAPGAHDRAHSDGYPWDAAQACAKQGLLGLSIPAAKGGQGAGLLAAVTAIQAVAQACPRSADVVQAGNFGPIRTFAEYATDTQRSRYLEDLLGGRKVIALGMTEPEAGSAATELKCALEPADGGYRMTGTKIFSTNSAEASVFLVYARFGPGVGGIGSVLVDRGAPGFEIGKSSRFMNDEQWCQLYFEDCFVPAEQVLLPAGGFKRQISGFNVERLGNAARSLALGRYALDRAVEHMNQRHQFGRPLAEFQGLQWMVADAYADLEAAQSMLVMVARDAEDGLPSAYETALVKLLANKAGFKSADVAVQCMGGMGFSQEALVEYCFRRTRGWMIAGGSVEVLKNRIAEGVFGRRFSQRGSGGE